jgi:hypothetical protein
MPLNVGASSHLRDRSSGLRRGTAGPSRRPGSERGPEISRAVRRSSSRGCGFVHEMEGRDGQWHRRCWHIGSSDGFFPSVRAARFDSKMKSRSQIAKGRWIFPFLTTVALVGSPAGACPICDSETGHQVRASLWNEDFGVNLLATALPFVVALGLTAVIHHGGLPRRSKHAADAEP